MEEKVKGIYHTHTKYSKFNHGKDSVKDMVDEAKSLGLVEYGITDHGPRHFFGIWKKNIPKLRGEIDVLKSDTNTKLVMGLEFNLLGNDGKTDFVNKYKDCFDIRFLGAHIGAWVGFKNLFTYYLPNIFCKNNKKVIERNTNAYINALKTGRFDCITHPNEFIKVDVKRLAEACVKYNCYLELNEKHMNLSSEDIAKILETDCKFLIGSDAHKKERILKLDRVMELIKKENIPSDRIANLNKLPNFKEKYNNI